MNKLWLLIAIPTFGVLYLMSGDLFTSLLCLFPAVVIVTILLTGVARIATGFYQSFLKPFWEWIVK